MTRTHILLALILIAILAATAPTPASAQVQDGDRLCYTPANSTVNVPACFPLDTYFDLSVDVYRLDQGRPIPVPGLRVEFLHVNFDISYSITSCVTDASGQCSLCVPENVVGSLVLDGGQAAQLGVDPIGYSDVFTVRHQLLQERVDEGYMIEDVFDTLYPYELKTARDEREMLVIASSSENDPYPNHWVLYTQESPQEPFVRNGMARFAPSAETLPPVLTRSGMETYLSPIDEQATPEPEVEAPVPTEQSDEAEGVGVPILAIVVVVILAAAILLFALRLRLLVAEK